MNHALEARVSQFHPAAFVAPNPLPQVESPTPELRKLFPPKYRVESSMIVTAVEVTARPVLQIRNAKLMGLLLLTGTVPPTRDLVRVKAVAGGVGMAVRVKVFRKYRLSHCELWLPVEVSDRTGTICPVLSL